MQLFRGIQPICSLLVLVTLSGLLSCHHKTPIAEPPRPLAAPYSSVAFAFRIHPTEVSVGDSVVIEWVLRNRTSHPVSLRFSDTCQLGVRLETEAGEYVWYSPQACGQIVTYILIAARDSVIERYELQTANSPGTKQWSYQPGRYRVIGTLNPSAMTESDRRVAPPLFFEIR